MMKVRDSILGENELNNRTRVGRNALRKACFKRRNVSMMRETLHEKRPGLIENRLQSYLTEVLNKRDPELCLYFLQEFKAELSETEITALETIILESDNQAVLECNKKSTTQASDEGDQG